MSGTQAKSVGLAGIRLAIVVPCRNEQEVLRVSVSKLLHTLDQLLGRQLASPDSFICIVDDGSTDGTWMLAEELHGHDARVRGLKLTRNFGHQGALLAGMFECEADAVVTIDADLQDDAACIEGMMKSLHEGCDIVLGVRDDRSSDSFFKRASAAMYYRLAKRVGMNVVSNHADFRLVSARAIHELRKYPESNLFLRGIIPLLGLRSSMVLYSRRARAGGATKYPLGRMLSLAWEGLTSFSVLPLRLVSGLGLLIAMAALAVSVWAILVKLVWGGAVPGWASTVVPIYFLGGVQILCLGVIGEYIGKIYLESKRRPRYSVESRIGPGREK